MITRNRAIDFHRRTRETEELPEDLPQQSHAEREAEEEAGRTLEAIRSLPEEPRDSHTQTRGRDDRP